MTKTRRSLMILLFMAVALAAGPFLTGTVCKPVEAAAPVIVAMRTSKNPNWSQLPSPGNGNVAYSSLYGYAPFDWATVAITLPKTGGGAPPLPPRTYAGITTVGDGSFATSRPSFTSETATSFTYYFRFNIPQNQRPTTGIVDVIIPGWGTYNVFLNQ